MSITVFIAILLAAMLHAVWNSIVKINGNKLLVMAILGLTEGSICAILIPFFPLPDKKMLICIFIANFFHAAYKIALIYAYKHGELNKIYTIIRGSAPIVVTALSFFFFHSIPSIGCIIGILLIVTGIMILTNFSFSKNENYKHNSKAFFFAITTGITVASYTIVAAIAVKNGGNPGTYMTWKTAIDMLIINLITFAVQRENMFAFFKKHFISGISGGTCSLCSYWIIV